MNISSTPAVYTFDVLPPWYQESYTVGLIFILASLLLLIIALLYIQNYRLEKTVKHRTLQLQTTNQMLQLESTGLRQMQRELKTLNSHLEDRVEERTQSLIQLNHELRNEILKRLETEKEKTILEESYYHAQRMESLGIFVGGIAHDFNNLLMGVILYCELLLMNDKHDDETVSHLKQIMESGKRASQMVKQLLTFSRKEKSAPILVNINELITLFQKTFSRLIGEDIKLTISLDDTVESIKIDPVQLEQVITNIVINARDAMPNGGSINIQTQLVAYNEKIILLDHDAPQSHYIKLSIEDSGIGMDEQTKAKIFDPFYTTKEVGKGTGLGLSSVYGIVKANHGYITVESELGSGTTFHLYFPVCDLEIEEIGIETKKPLPIKAHETILVLEDDVMVLHVVQQTLSKQGYSVLITKDVDEAVEIANQKKDSIDLVITDLVMPKCNGIEIAYQIRDFIPHVKVLFMSGYIRPDFEEPIHLDFGGNIIHKPFQTSELTLKVQSILRHHNVPFN
jgi:signal transduction histidine kinase